MGYTDSAALLCIALAQGAPVRPCDPWVFRGALEGHPRAVFVALASDLALAYDAATCSLVSVSGGAIERTEATAKLAGAVYTSGPDGNVWWIERGDRALAADVLFRGYRFQAGQVILRYELSTPDGLQISIEETPELERPSDLYEDPSSGPPWMKPELVGLRRTFKATGIPAGARVCLTLRVRCAGYVAYDRILPEGEREARSASGAVERELFARLLIESENSTNDIHFFFAPPAPMDASAAPPGGDK